MSAKRLMVQLRISDGEKHVFQKAADLDGKTLCGWMRDRLRDRARHELESRGLQVSFVYKENIGHV